MQFGFLSPEQRLQAMRDELTSNGFEELRTPDEVERAFEDKLSSGSGLLVFNSVCGCAAGGARPGVVHALREEPKPDALVTVFAGQDPEATQQARQHLAGFAPSSPSVFLFKDGEPVFSMARSDIEGRPAEDVARALREAIDKHLG